MADDIQLIPVALPAALTVGTVQTIQFPENGEIARVTVTLNTAPVGSTAAFDVLDKGTSVFSLPLGTVRAGTTAQGQSGQGVLVGDTTLVIDPSAAGVAPVQGQVLTIDSEDVTVTAVSGDPRTTGASPEYSCTITRGSNGTTAAAHTPGTAIFPAKPKVVAGQTTTSGNYVASPAVNRNVPPITAGDAVAVTVTAIGSTTAGGGGEVALETVQR